MRKTLTWAELILIIILSPVAYVGVQHLYGFVTDRISVEVRFK